MCFCTQKNVCQHQCSVVSPIATVAGIGDDERVEATTRDVFFKLLNTEGAVVEAPVACPYLAILHFSDSWIDPSKPISNLPDHVGNIRP